MATNTTETHRDKTVTRAIHSLFWEATKQHKGYLILNQLCNIPALALINVFIPVQVAFGIQAILVRNFDKVHHQAVAVLVISLISAVVFAIGTWANHRCVVLGSAHVQRKVFANYLNKDYDFYSNHHIGSLGADAAALRMAYTDYTLLIDFDILKAVIIIFIGLAVVMYQSLVLGLVTAVCVACILLTVVFAAGFRLRYRRALGAASSALSGVIGDPLSHGATVKSFAQEDYEQQRLTKPLRVWKQAQLKAFDTSIPQSTIRNTFLAITLTILLLLSARLYQDGSITIASVVLVQLYITRIVNTAVDINQIIKKYEALMSDAYEPMATMLIPNHVVDQAETKAIPEQKSYGLHFKAVSYHYPDAAQKSRAVHDFTLDIKAGEKVGLIGYSGGGKTTITKLLLRFMDVDQGSISVDATDIRELKQTDLRKAIAYVPQEPLLFHRSIKENIAYARPDASQKEIAKAAQIAFVDDFTKDLPAGYDTMVGERGVKLSGGQRQRVAIARALLKDAPILVLDEATSALDSQSEKYIQKALWELMEKRTAIVIAHRLSTIQRMDRIVVMDKGEIVQIGTHHDLLKDKKGIYARLWAHQSDGYLSLTES